MKKSILFAAMAAMFLCSCGTAKKTSSTTPQYVTPSSQGTKTAVTKVKEEIDECEEKSYDWSDGRMKAYASAINPDRDLARTNAAVNARVELAASISALVTNVVKSYRASVAKGTPTKATYESSISQTADALAQEQMAYTHIVCSNRYQINDANGISYEVSVCVAMDNQIESTCKKAVERLSNEDVLGVKFNEEQFRKSYQEELEAYRQSKMNR